jgi:hypothetical protein
MAIGMQRHAVLPLAAVMQSVLLDWKACPNESVHVQAHQLKISNTRAARCLGQEGMPGLPALARTCRHGPAGRDARPGCALQVTLLRERCKTLSLV